MRRLVLTAALLLIPVAAAPAAEPASGEVSQASPEVGWTGSTTNSWINYTLINADNGADCQPTTCDSFALKVADGGFDLVVKVRMEETASDGSNGQGGVRITRPDGEVVWTTGESGPDKDLKVTVKKAAQGDYAIDFVNTFVGGVQGHVATATLMVPPPPVAPVAPPVAAPPAEAPPAATALTVRPLKVPARKSRRMALRVSASGPVTGLTAVLAKGRRRVAKGRLSRLDGDGRLLLRGKRRLKPGRYRVTVTGTDASGKRLSARGAVTVRRK